jgi:hypothetical protein
MARRVQLIRVFISSPMDCVEERQRLAQAVRLWNVSAGPGAGLYLEPVMWETHCHPELSSGPQEAINLQVVDQCDMLVAVFRTRLGTPTASAASGTVEEIDRCRGQGKGVMIYFLEALQVVGEARQVEALNRYRAQAEIAGLVGTFTSAEDLEFQFGSRHLHTVVNQRRWILAAHGDDRDRRPVPDISMIASAEQALRFIRDETKYLWPGLVYLRRGETGLVCEVRANTLERISPSLQYLAQNSELTYSVVKKYQLLKKKTRVLKIHLEDISESLKILVKRIDQEPTNYATQWFR